MTTKNPKSVNHGVVASVRGSVVDIRFDDTFAADPFCSASGD